MKLGNDDFNFFHLLSFSCCYTGYKDIVGAFSNLHYNTVKSHFKALGLYKFKRGFGWAYKRGGGLIPGGLISGIKRIKRI